MNGEIRDQLWWSRLRHFGLLLGPGQIAMLEQEPLDDLSPLRVDQLRREIGRLDAGDIGPGEFIAWLLETICGFEVHRTGNWRRGSDVPSDWSRLLVTGESVKPRHLWSGPHGALLPVFFDTAGEHRLGLYRGRKKVSDIIQWLRAVDRPFALLTNGRQLRLVFAGLDHQAACEWDVEQFFEQGEPGPQLEALRRLLTPKRFIPADSGADPPLLDLVRAARRGQSELSAVLGERVRDAVERLVRNHGPALNDSDLAGDAIYRAAVHVVMRLVFVLFAESRGLLPRDNPLYAISYSLHGLFEELDRLAAAATPFAGSDSAGDGGRLRQRHGAWPRLLALFRLIHDGSHHEALPVPAYGGDLFAPGDPDIDRPWRRAVHLFETACFDHPHGLMSDSVVHRMLERLTRTRVRIRQGRSSTWTTVPVDFSDLSTEYIGILYEGLLDYELRAAPADEPIVFLAVGNEPALPLSRLEAMDDAQIESLFDSLKDTSGDEETKAALEETELALEEIEADFEPDEVEDEEDAEGDDAPADEEDGDETAVAAREAARTRATEWTHRACRVVGMVKKPGGAMTPEKRQTYERNLAAKAEKMVRRLVLPGEWYLVRWGGTRKGSGTFYTPPQLAVPLAHRTLRPLAYDPPPVVEGEHGRDAPPAAWTPKPPEEILSLTVCDPACGSGTFPLVALRFLTDALYASLFAHDRLENQDERTLVQILRGSDREERIGDEYIPCCPDADDFEPRLRAVLRRYVVERSIYGVDLDPLAVELCKLSLWIETMDRELPFSFLDHKIRCGDSLVGCWLDEFQHYPAMAWGGTGSDKRDGGDSNHTNGVHFDQGERTDAIYARRGTSQNNDPGTVCGELVRLLEGPTLFSEDLQEQALETHDHALAALLHLHQLPVHRVADRAHLYMERFRGSDEWRQLKSALDRWCALWFWPADQVEKAPLPTEFADPSEESREVARRIAAERRFFHWELEFPDVFNEEGTGFDAVIGNPPWETLQPQSKEFFSNIDPLYRSYGRQEAKRHQETYFDGSREIEKDWLDYNAHFSALSNHFQFAWNPFGDPERDERAKFTMTHWRTSNKLHDAWRQARGRSSGYADPDHPYRHQGAGKAYTYKLFVERGWSLLDDAGRLGFVVPSGLYSDYGSDALRALFLDAGRWEWLFGFENRDKIFDIHRSFKFNPIVVEKGGTTDAIHTAFMHRKLEDWEEAEAHAVPYSREQVHIFSPSSRAMLEIQSQRDLEILDTIYANSVLLGKEGPEGWGIEYSQGDFNMTSDSELFPPRPEWEEKGYCPDEYSRWLKGDWQPRTRTSPAPPGSKRVEIPEGVILSRDGESWILEERVDDMALPLYEGRMLSSFDYSAKGWVRGKGRGAVWQEISWQKKVINPQYLMARRHYPYQQQLNTNVLHKRIGSGTNERSTFAAMTWGMPAGDTAAKFDAGDPTLNLFLSALFNSLIFDFVMRLRLVGLHLDYHVFEQNPLLPTTHYARPSLQSLSAKLNLVGSYVSPIRFFTSLGHPVAITASERLRLKANSDAVAAASWGLDQEQLSWVLRHCDRPKEQLRQYGKAPDLYPKGFWRVNKKKDPELRHTVLTIVAFHDLQEKIRERGGDRDAGIEAFCAQNDGEGWMIPETLRLADYGLGHDDRADRPQPVSSRLGTRFYDWQLEQDPEESWAECRLHARNLLGPDRFEKLMKETDQVESEGNDEAPPRTTIHDEQDSSGQVSLF